MCVCFVFVTRSTEAPGDAAEDEAAGEKAAEEQMPQEAAEEEEEPDDVDAEDQPSGQQCDLLEQILELPSKPWISGSFGRLFVAKGTNQSYIQQKVNGMLSLLVSISKAASPRHQMLIDHVLRFALGNNLSKQMVMDYKHDLFSDIAR